MKNTGVAKPVVKVYLLPAEWDEQVLQDCFNKILENLKTVQELNIQTEDDVIVLFPSDRMRKGLGTEIHVEVDLPSYLVCHPDTEDKTASAVFETVRFFLPEAAIQCKTYTFDVKRGFRSTNR